MTNSPTVSQTDRESSDYASTTSAAALAQVIRKATRVLLLTHSKPDGDAVGSVVALRRALEQCGVRADILLMGPIDQALLAVLEGEPVRRLEREGPPPEEPDLIMLVDTGSWSQVEALRAWLVPRMARIVGVDHHRRGDAIAALRLVDWSCASTTQALMPLLKALEVRISAELATPLFMGLATDTGWFRFSSADAAVLRLASELLGAGAAKDWLFATLEQNARPSRLSLTARALASIEFVDPVGGGRIAVMTLSRDDFAETGGGSEDTGGVVNEPLVIREVRASILLSQHEAGVTRVSFRSKPDLIAPDGRMLEPGLDVNELAARFGGGGHVQAAGARIAAELDEARKTVMAEIRGKRDRE